MRPPTADATSAARTGRTAGHAVVLGASIAGLAVAKALSTGFDRVTLVERDTLPADAAHRRGVGQGHHLHVLLTSGKQALEELFPGLIDELAADGAVHADLAEHGRMWLDGRQLALGPAGPADISASRPFVEAHIRARVRDVDAIHVLEQHDAKGLVTAEDRQRVVGVDVAGPDSRATRRIDADLVVDCSGRGSPSPRWLERLGFAAPPVEELKVDLCYATRQYRMPPDALDGDLLAMVGPQADDARGGWLARIEADTWIVTLAGMAGLRPPSDPDGFENYAASLHTPVIAEAIQAGDALDRPVSYRFPASRRRCYERLRTFPDGLLVAGDAVCSFNPIYGQGMTVAAMEALALRDHLERTGPPTARTWFREIARLVDTPWDLAKSGDLAIRGIEGYRSIGARVLDRYMNAYLAAAEHDAILGVRFVRVTSLLEPPGRLLNLDSIRRVLTHLVSSRPHRSGADGAPAQIPKGRTDRERSAP
jgi:2-polyprenyl-6-methoxyphenol hydroxylase-like FAD-dependent oxidoreductase